MSDLDKTYEPYIVGKLDIGSKILINGVVQDVWIPFKNKNRIDLKDEILPIDTTIIVFEKIKSIVNIQTLSSLENLKRLSFLNTEIEEIKKSSFKLDHINSLEITDCSIRTKFFLLQNVKSVNEFRLIDYANEINCAQFKHFTSLKSLSLKSPVIRNVDLIPSKEIKAAFLASPHYDESFSKFLYNANSLEKVFLLTIDPIYPKMFKKEILENLKELTVIRNDETYDSWLEWSENNKQVLFETLSKSYAEMPTKSGKLKVNSVHWGLSILEYKNKKSPIFEISDDAIGKFNLDEIGNNGDLEEILVSKLDPNKEKYDWNSEADTLVVSSTSLEQIKKVIDEIAKLG